MDGGRAREMDWGSSKSGTAKACWRAPAALVAHSPLHPREQRMWLQVMTAGGVCRWSSGRRCRSDVDVSAWNALGSEDVRTLYSPGAAPIHLYGWMYQARKHWTLGGTVSGESGKSRV